MPKFSRIMQGRSGSAHRLAAAMLHLGLALAIVACIAPASAATFTLADALSVAYETNPDLARARAALAALDQGVAQANAGWRPSVNASASYGIEHGTIQNFPTALDSNPQVGSVTVSQPLYRGGRTYAEVGRAIADVHTGQAQLLTTEHNVLVAAVAAYMDVVRDTDGMRINQENVKSLQDELDAVRTQQKAGAVTKTDVQQTEARLAKAQADAAIAEEQLAASRSAFESVIGRPAESLQDMPPLPRLPATKDEALTIALRQNSDLVAARFSAHAADYAVDDAVGAMLPQVSVTGQYQYLRDSAGTNIYATKSPQQIVTVIGQLNVPLYQGGADEATVRRAKDVRMQSTLAVVSAERSTRQDIDNAWQALRAARLAATANEAQAEADRAALAGVKQEQQAGERSVLDVLNAQQELFGAEVAAAASRHDSVVAAYKLLAVTGQLTAKFLKLDVKIYDPLKHYDDNASAWFGFGE